MHIAEPFSDIIDRVHGTLASPDNVYERRLSAMAEMYFRKRIVQIDGKPAIIDNESPGGQRKQTPT